MTRSELYRNQISQPDKPKSPQGLQGRQKSVKGGRQKAFTGRPVSPNPTELFPGIRTRLTSHRIRTRDQSWSLRYRPFVRRQFVRIALLFYSLKKEAES
jgi:hypothetical protein